MLNVFINVPGLAGCYVTHARFDVTCNGRENMYFFGVLICFYTKFCMCVIL